MRLTRAKNDWFGVGKVLHLDLHISFLLQINDRKVLINQFQFSLYMLRRVLQPLKALARHTITLPFRYKPSPLINFYSFSTAKGLTVSEIPAQNIQIKASQATIGEQQVEVFRTSGGISILQKVPGVKAASGQLYVLSFRCTVCDTQSIRSFTKHSYHKGVVMVRCGGCQRIHLVADNLGWFQDQPVNIQTMHEGQVRKVRDPVAIVQFLNKAFEEDNNTNQNSTSNPANEDTAVKHNINEGVTKPSD